MAKQARAQFKLFDRRGAAVGLATFAGKSFKKAKALGARVLGQVGIRKSNPIFSASALAVKRGGRGTTRVPIGRFEAESHKEALRRAIAAQPLLTKHRVKKLTLTAGLHYYPKSNPQAMSYLRAWKKATLAGHEKKSKKLLRKYVARKVRDKGAKSLYTIRTGNKKKRRGNPIAVGDKVAYSVSFLRSIGMAHSDMARARGIVTDVTTLAGSTKLARIDWGSWDMPGRVNVANLAKVGGRGFAAD